MADPCKDIKDTIDFLRCREEQKAAQRRKDKGKTDVEKGKGFLGLFKRKGSK